MKQALSLLVAAFSVWCGAAYSVEFPEIFPAQGRVQVAFTPWDNVEALLRKEIANAKQEILVQVYLFNSRALASALIAAQRRGVSVKVLVDRDKVFEPGSHSRIPELHQAGIEVWLEVKYAAAHNKIMLIDASTAHPVVVTGSYNFTYSAQRRNAENVLIVRDHPRLAQRYAHHWVRHQREALPYLNP